MPSAIFAPLSLAILGVLSVSSVHGQAGIASVYPQCATKDQGVCCLVLGSCTGQDDPSCDIKAMGEVQATLLAPSANTNAPTEQHGCYGGVCLLALNAATTSCSLTYAANACAVCEPVYGKNPRGALCSYQTGGNCCYLQAGGTNPDGFQGCKSDADCLSLSSGFPDLIVYQCIEQICFFYTGGNLCNSNFEACDTVAFENTAIHKTCNALANDATGSPVPDFFPSAAPAPGVAPAPGPETPPKPTPTSSPTANPTATPAAAPAGGSQPTGVPAIVASTPPAVPTPGPAPTPSPSGGSGAPESVLAQGSTVVRMSVFLSLRIAAEEST